MAKKVLQAVIVVVKWWSEEDIQRVVVLKIN